jgi:hypothetical protein
MEGRPALTSQDGKGGSWSWKISIPLAQRAAFLLKADAVQLIEDVRFREGAIPPRSKRGPASARFAARSYPRGQPPRGRDIAAGPFLQGALQD